MIESLMDIQIAYNMMNDKTPGDSMFHPLDTHYFKLNCAIDVSYLFILSLSLSVFFNYVFSYLIF